MVTQQLEKCVELVFTHKHSHPYAQTHIQKCFTDSSIPSAVQVNLDEQGSDDNLELLGAADGNGMSWDWAKLPTHEHDSDPTTFFAALAVLSMLVVIIFFVNVVYKARRRPPRRKTRVRGIHRLNLYNSKTSGV